MPPLEQFNEVVRHGTHAPRMGKVGMHGKPDGLIGAQLRLHADQPRLPRQILEAPKSIAEHAIGSGPFVLESYTRDQGATFVKRKGYNWAPPVTRHNGEAYLDRLELSIVPEPMIRFSALESGQSDFTVDAPAQNARAIRSRAVPGRCMR